MIKSSKSKKYKILFYSAVLIVLLIASVMLWNYIFKSNTKLEGKNFDYIKVPKNTNYAQFLKIIEESNAVNNISSFDLYARNIGLDEKIIPGRYRVNAGMSNRQIAKMFKNGNEEKVELNVNYTTRTKEHLIEKLISKFNIDKEKLVIFLENNELLEKTYGLDQSTITLLVRPKKYLLSWSTDEKDFFDIMKKEYDDFWNEDRLNKLKKIKMNKEEVMIMASIIEWESKIESEQRKIAGVYMNRLSKNIPLQADPTVIFALNNFSIRRVSFQDLKFDSPYNTYKYKGLPPGPIGFPADKAINSVLNYESSDWLYFCAKPELNGYSNFSSNLEQHEAFAREYRESLNRRGIKR
jgi:UPF0755 protein